MSDVLERLRERGAGSTHWAGCEGSHLDCAAVLEIERLRRELDEARAALLAFAQETERLWDYSIHDGLADEHAAALKAAREAQ